MRYKLSWRATLLALGFTLSGCGLIQVHYTSSVNSGGSTKSQKSYSHARSLSEGRAQTTGPELNQARPKTIQRTQPHSREDAAWEPESMPAQLTRVTPNPSLPLPAPRPASQLVAGIGLGMTESEVLASCSRRTNPTIHEVRPALDRSGNEVSATTDPRKLLGGSYLRNITCFSSDTGLTDIGFAAPPYQRVVRVSHTDYRISNGKSVHAEQYLRMLGMTYGKFVDKIGPEKIRGDSFAMTYKWRTDEQPFDLDCAPPVAERDRVVFGMALLEGMPCASHLTVRVAFETPTALQAFAADYTLINIRSLADAEHAHIELVNKTYGTALSDRTTQSLENLGRRLVCEAVVENTLKSYVSGKREETTDRLIDRLFPPRMQSFMKNLVNSSDLDDMLFTAPSHDGAVAACQVIFAIYDQHKAEGAETKG